GRPSLYLCLRATHRSRERSSVNTASRNPQRSLLANWPFISTVLQDLVCGFLNSVQSAALVIPGRAVFSRIADLNTRPRRNQSPRRATPIDFWLLLVSTHPNYCTFDRSFIGIGHPHVN